MRYIIRDQATGKPLGRVSLDTPLAPCPEPFAYTWETEDQAHVMAAQYIDKNGGKVTVEEVH